MTLDEITEGKSLLCPSAPGKEGTLLVGVIQNSKTVSFLDTVFDIDYRFIAVSKHLGPLEKRFRFATTCLKSDCKQWASNECSVIKMLSNLNKHTKGDSILKPCSIREQCQWFHQDKEKACTLCTFVTTDYLEETETIPTLHKENN